MLARVQSILRSGLSLLPWALLAAVGFGAAESVFLLARQTFVFKLAFVGEGILWMAPLGYALLFTAALGATLLPRFVFRDFPTERCFRFATGFLGTIGFLQTIPGLNLHWLAVVVVASAIGVQLGRADPHRLKRGWLVGVLVLATAGVFLSAAMRLRHRIEAVASVPVGARGDRPNILFVVWDTVRELDLSLYGYTHSTTPFLERWAARGVVFDRAFATSSWTLPSHASLFTGRFPHEVSADFDAPLDAAFPTLAEVLRTQGYRTAGFAGNPYYTSKETGLARGFERWEDYRLTLKEILLSAGVMQWFLGERSARVLRRHDLKRAPEITDEFLGWIDREAPQPFFAFLNYFDAHIPYYAAPEMLKRFAAFDEPTRVYDAAIASLDAELERLLRALETRGKLEHTIIVVTSDHGEQFGGHGLFDHANSLYRQVIQVPLVVIAPGRIPAGLRVPVPVSLRNVPATILDLAGVTGQPLPGESHTRFWEGVPEVTQDDPVLSELTPAPGVPLAFRNARGEIRSLVEGRFHYILGLDGHDELFDLTLDPKETQSLKGREYLPRLALIWNRLRSYDFGFPRKRPGIPAPN